MIVVVGGVIDLASIIEMTFMRLAEWAIAEQTLFGALQRPLWLRRANKAGLRHRDFGVIG